MSLSVPTRACLGKAISFSLAVNEYCKNLQSKIEQIQGVSNKLNREKLKTELFMTEREAVGRGEGVNDLLLVEHRQLLVKWLPSPRALFFSCMRDHIKLNINLCFKVDDLLC